MIKFFRHLRQAMVKENRVSKYMLYAIGEIVLVVIGILIALQINTWNKTQSDIKTETISLKNLVQDLEKQSTSLDEYIVYESDYIANGVEVLKHYAKHKAFVEMDSIQADLYMLSERRTFNPITTTFEELNSTGDIALIRNEGIKREVIKYYNDLERVALIISNNNTNHVDAMFNSVLIKHSGFRSRSIHDLFLGEVDSVYKADLFKKMNSISEKMLSKPENEMHLFSALELRTGVANHHKILYELLQKETTTLTELLKSELEGN